MIISHISNSFFVIELGHKKMVCDPWVGHAFHGGWHSFPEYDRQELIDLVKDADYTYISHIHSDHLDIDFLAESSLIHNSQIIIKNFENPDLKNRLIKMGVRDLKIIDGFSKTNLDHGIEIAIIPQMTSTTSGLVNDIEYDMDTSIVIKWSDITFFNQVDNPLSLSDSRIVKILLAKNLGR